MAEPSELKAALQAELKAVKEQCDDVKMGCAKKDAENAPFPVWVSKPVQRPPVVIRQVLWHHPTPLLACPIAKQAMVKSHSGTLALKGNLPTTKAMQNPARRNTRRYLI